MSSPQQNGAEPAPHRERLYFLDNVKFILLYGIVLHHYGRCGDHNQCFPQEELRDAVGEDKSILNTLPRVLGGCALFGFVFLSGSVLADHDFVIKKEIHLFIRRVLIAGSIMYIAAPIVDTYILPSAVPTTGHLWFLWMVIFGRACLVLLHHFGVLKNQYMFLGLIALLLVICGLICKVFAVNVEEVDTWSNPEWHSIFGPRLIFGLILFLIGALYAPITKIHEITMAISANRVYLFLAAAWTASVLYNFTWNVDVTVLITNCASSFGDFMMRCSVTFITAVLLFSGAIGIGCFCTTKSWYSKYAPTQIFCYVAHPFFLKLTRIPVTTFMVELSSSDYPEWFVDLVFVWIIIVYPLLLEIALCEIPLLTNKAINFGKRLAGRGKGGKGGKGGKNVLSIADGQVAVEDGGSKALHGGGTTERACCGNSNSNEGGDGDGDVEAQSLLGK